MVVVSIVIVRHAKAESGEGRADHDRRLTDRGLRTAAEAGRWLAERLPEPGEVWCSSAVRAVQTWEQMAPALRAPEAQVSRDLYLADARDLAERLRGATGDLVVVGHNPTLEEVVHALTGELCGLRPGAVAVVDGEAGRLVEHWDPPR
jgi:phosphohistidine phosphatase